MIIQSCNLTVGSTDATKSRKNMACTYGTFPFILETLAFSMILGYFLAHESVLARVACDGLTRYFLARPFLRPNIWPFKTLFGPKAILTGKFDPQSFIWTHIWLLSRYFNVKKIRREILEKIFLRQTKL